MAEKNVNQVLDEIQAEIGKLGTFANEENMRNLVADQIKALSADDPEFRKMIFGDNKRSSLIGTKYHRYGLSVGDIEWLWHLRQSVAGLSNKSGDRYPEPSEYLTSTMRAISDARFEASEDLKAMDEKALRDMFGNVPASFFKGDDRGLAEDGKWELTRAYQDAMRAMDTAESGFGSQLVGAQYVGELWEAAARQSRLFNLIESFEMSDPTAYLPVEVDIPELLFVAESTANNSSNYDTVKTGSQRVQVDAKKFVIHQMWSVEMEEDAIIPFIPFLRRQAALSIAHYSDSLVLNGDTTNAGTGNINLDDADPADTKHYLAFDGIRHAALVDNTNNVDNVAAALSYDDLLNIRALMLDTTRLVDWGHPIDPNDLVYVGDPTTVDKIALLDEVITVDKMGALATVLNGEQAKVGRHPLISSMAMSKTEADGKVSTTGGNNTLGQVAVFNRRAFVTGWRRRVKIMTEELPATDQRRIVYSMRLGFGRFTPTGAASGIEAAAVLRNITI